MNFKGRNKNLYIVAAVFTLICVLIYEMKFRVQSIRIEEEGKTKELRGMQGLLHKYVQSQQNAMEMNHVDKFVKHLSLGERYERNDELRNDMKSLANRLTRFLNIGNRKEEDTRGLTIILNAVNEIQNLDSLLDDLEKSSRLNWTKSVHILLGVSKESHDKNSVKLSEIRKKIPSFEWVVMKQDTLAKTLFWLVENVDRQYILVSKKLRKLPVEFDVEKFLNPLKRGSSDVVSGSLSYPDGRWETGCYQTKHIWSQYRIQYGTDIKYKRRWVKCDYIDGPFALYAGHLLTFLSEHSGLPDDLLYPELIYTLNREGKTMKKHLCTIFSVGTDEPELGKLSRDRWKHFIQRNEMTEIFLTTVATSSSSKIKETYHEFDYKESKAKCQYLKKNMLKPRACMRELHLMLINSYKLFDRLGYTYTTEDGSGVAATKLHDTLPWDIDQDFAFRSQNMTSLYHNEALFKEIGITFGPDIDVKAKCLSNSSLAKPPIGGCGYIGMHGKNWKLENWGAHVLNGDYYEPWKIEPQFKNIYPPNRIHGHHTKVKMGDHWAQNRANPGLYIRSHYGLDILRHANHWSKLGFKDSWEDYKPGTHFGGCPDEGHHRCMTEYLSDGNIQFQRPWA
ncbi:uncharacterized protein [Clytia hemisphaerica]|uniref:Uncharacterized protein n=1 Tax=Clytia hemisphaerica TaxID=252671 RepID=A0A7M6DRA1_9CNID